MDRSLLLHLLEKTFRVEKLVETCAKEKMPYQTRQKIIDVSLLNFYLQAILILSC
jgi:hypothetical protein